MSDEFKAAQASMDFWQRLWTGHLYNGDVILLILVMFAVLWAGSWLVYLYEKHKHD